MNAARISTLSLTRAEWLDLRHEGIGGSDVSAVLGLNPYKASAELFYEKVLKINQTEENEAMFFGKQLEDKIAELWQYWEGSPESMISNYNEEKIIRRSKRVNAILKHKDYNWLSANVDRLIIDKGNTGVLEIKTVSGWAADQWRDGIPPSYLTQLQTYLLITGYEYGEIAILRDGRYMQVHPFKQVPEIIDAIISRTQVFWENVLTARDLLYAWVFDKEIYSVRDFLNIAIPDDVKYVLSDLEPAPDDSIAYENYLKDRYKIIPVTKQGTYEQLTKAIQYQSYQTIIKDYEKLKRGISNELKSQMGEAECLDFGNDGRITHKEDSRGARRFNVNITGGNK